MARLREGTEILRTGGGTTLTAEQCNALLDHIEAQAFLLGAIAFNAESWHAGDEGKGRALAVIAKWARGEEVPHPEIGRG